MKKKSNKVWHLQKSPPRSVAHVYSTFSVFSIISSCSSTCSTRGTIIFTRSVTGGVHRVKQISWTWLPHCTSKPCSSKTSETPWGEDEIETMVKSLIWCEEYNKNTLELNEKLISRNKIEPSSFQSPPDLNWSAIFKMKQALPDS